MTAVGNMWSVLKCDYVAVNSVSPYSLRSICNYNLLGFLTTTNHLLFTYIKMHLNLMHWCVTLGQLTKSPSFKDHPTYTNTVYDFGVGGKYQGLIHQQ
jgi:hypothetical protein